MADYYPSAKVRIGVRFEDFTGASSPLKGPTVPTTAARGTKPARTNLAPQQTTTPDGRRVFTILPSGAAPSPSPSTSRSASSDGLTFVVPGVVPIEATWERKGFAKGATLTCSVPFRVLPFYPEVVRSAWVEFYAGVVTPTEFEAGVRGTTRVEGGGLVPANLIPDSYATAGGVRSNRRLVGWVDKWDVDFPASAPPVVLLECRDNTALLVDQEHGAQFRFDATVAVDEMVAKYLANYPQFAGISVEYRGAGVPPVLQKALHTVAMVNGTVGGGPGANTGKQSVLDVLTEVTGKLGLFVHVDDFTVVLTSPTTIYRDGSTNPDDPFAATRRIAYGRVPEKFKVSRSYAQQQPSNVEVHAYNPERGATLVARYPTNAVVDAKPGDGATENRIRVYRVTGVKDMQTLLAVARAYYDAQGKRELTTTWDSLELASSNGAAGVPDLLDIRCGSSLDFRAVPDPAGEDLSAATTADREAQATATMSAYVQAAGHGKEIADAYARQYVALRSSMLWKANTLSVKWTDGDQPSLRVGGTAVNYIYATYDPKDVPPGTGAGAKATGASGSNKPASTQVPVPPPNAIGQNPDGTFITR